MMLISSIRKYYLNSNIYYFAFDSQLLKKREKKVTHWSLRIQAFQCPAKIKFHLKIK